MRRWSADVTRPRDSALTLRDRVHTFILRGLAILRKKEDSMAVGNGRNLRTGRFEIGRAGRGGLLGRMVRPLPHDRAGA